MSAPARIQLSRAKGWRMPENTIKVDRRTPFGNPFAVVAGKVCGGSSGPVWRDAWFVPGYENHEFATKAAATELAVRVFAAWIEHPAQRKLLAAVQFGLRGKKLACWCKAGTPCHADILLRLANPDAAISPPDQKEREAP